MLQLLHVVRIRQKMKMEGYFLKMYTQQLVSSAFDIEGKHTVISGETLCNRSID
jgi:hypothetical protein